MIRKIVPKNEGLEVVRSPPPPPLLVGAFIITIVKNQYVNRCNEKCLLKT